MVLPACIGEGGPGYEDMMVNDRIKGRMWRIGAALAPFVALALSLEAGRRWV